MLCVVSCTKELQRAYSTDPVSSALLASLVSFAQLVMPLSLKRPPSFLGFSIASSSQGMPAAVLGRRAA
jgi:hypothetical protein